MSVLPPADRRPSGQSSVLKAERSAEDLFEPINEDLSCPRCGYNLRSLTGRRCPECGRDIQSVREGRIDNPWELKEQGIVRSYVSAVWMVFTQQRWFFVEIVERGSYRAARSFRWITVLCAFVPFLIMAATFFATGMIPPDGKNLYSATSLLLGLFAFLAVSAAVPYYVISHPDIPLDRQERAAVLSMYACAPMSCTLTWITPLTLGLVNEILGNGVGLVTSCWFLAALGFFLLILFYLPFDVVRMIRWSIGDEAPMARITAKLFGCWLVGACFTLLGIPFAMAFIAAVYYSLNVTR